MDDVQVYDLVFTYVGKSCTSGLPAYSYPKAVEARVGDDQNWVTTLEVFLDFLEDCGYSLGEVRKGRILDAAQED